MNRLPVPFRNTALFCIFLLIFSGHVAAACIDGINPKNGKSCGGGGDGGGEPVTATCSDVFFGGNTGLCTAAGTMDECTVSRFGDNTPGWKATEDCDLRATLVTPPGDPIFDGNGHTFNLVAPWSADNEAGFSNGQGDYRLNDFTINVATTAVANGCTLDGLTVQTAVRIDQDAPESGVPRPGAGNLIITTSNGAMFCNAIEYRGSDPQIRIPQFAGGPGDNFISGDSYERAAIWLSDLNLTDNVNGQPKNWDFAGVMNNYIEGSCEPGSVGIYYGPNVERGRIQNNVIVPNSLGCGNAIGILVTDSGREKQNGNNYDFLAADPIIVSDNAVATDANGGSTAIVFDADSDATTGSNELTAGDGSDTGMCIETGANVDLGTGRNADSFTGFGTNVATPAGC